MKKTATLNTGVETKSSTQTSSRKGLMTTALLAVLLGFGINGMAQEVAPQGTPKTQTEQVQKKTSLAVHGMLSLGTNGIARDNATVLSTNPSLTGVLSVSHPQSGFGVTAIRVDDGRQDDSSQPSSRATVINTNWKKKFGENKQFGVIVDGKYTLLDKNPDLKIVTTDIVGSYSTKTGWTIEGMYLYNITSGSDAVRLSIIKQLDDAVELVGRIWYESGRLYGSGEVNVKLEEGPIVKVSAIFKDGQVIPSACVSIAL